MRNDNAKIPYGVQFESSAVIVGANRRGIRRIESRLQRIAVGIRAVQETDIGEEQAGSVFLLRDGLELRGIARSVGSWVQCRGRRAEQSTQHIVEPKRALVGTEANDTRAGQMEGKFEAPADGQMDVGFTDRR